MYSLYLFDSEMATTISRRKVPPKNVTIHSCHKRPAHSGAEYNPHRDALSLREARNGSNAANYAAKEPAGFKGSLWGLYSAPLCAALSAAMKGNVICKSSDSDEATIREYYTELGRETGLNEGLKKGEEYFVQLTSHLLQDSRTNDLLRGNLR